MHVNFSKTAQDYARFRRGFPDSFFERLTLYGIGRENQRILDLGAGAGSMSRGLARAGCEVSGIDYAQEILVEARKIDAREGLKVAYTLANVEHCCFADGSFDVVAAGQCWHWFDRAKTIKEVKRILVRGGTLLIAYFDWIPLPDSVVEATEEIVLAHNPKWDRTGSNGLHPEWLRGAADAGFTELETFSYGVDLDYTHDEWRGRVRASGGVGGTLPPEKTEDVDRALAAVLTDRFPQEPLTIHHRVFAVVGKCP
ncbi:MAG: class I SAM-dependent methyltransferase [Planctomycetota bacterium]